MHIALIQFDIAWEDKPANHTKIEEMIEQADLPAHTIVLLPEMGDTGFSFNLDTIVDEQTLPWAKRVAQQRTLWLQVGYAIRGDDGCGRNCATLVSPQGETVGTYHKVHPFSYGKESEYFTGGERLFVGRIDDTAICPLICYDLRFPELWRLATVAGAEIFAIGANWPAARQHHWRSLLIARAIENQAYIVACNRTGSDPHLAYAGGSIIIAPSGEVLAEADDQPAVLQRDIDIESLRGWRKKFPAIQDLHRDLLGKIAVDQ